MTSDRLILAAARCGLALLLAVGAAASAHAQDAADEDGGRVIGGRKARAGEWPWQVKILAPDAEQRGRFAGHCGGALISPRWILTAAHCLSNGRSGRQDLFARDLLIVEGKTEVAQVVTVTGEDAGGIKVEDAIVHEGFDRKTFANDIALIHLSEPATSRPASLAGPADAALESEGAPVTVTGWGYTKADHGWDQKYLPTDLQEVELPIVSREACRAGYRETSMRMNPIDERNLCAGYKEGGKDACQGDSGGPLVGKRPDGSFAQLGIVSWGAGCAEADHYGVYTRVAAFRDWIAAKTNGEVPADGPATAGEAVAAAQPPQAPAVAAEEPHADAPAPQAGTAAETTASEAPSADADAQQPDVAALEPGAGEAVSEEAPADAEPRPRPLGPVGTPGDRALIVGIDDYAIKEARLKGSVSDAEAMQHALTRTFGFKPDQITVLTDGQATREGILAAIDDELVRGSAAGGRVLFYFAGQGSQEVGGNVSSPTLVPVDAQIERKKGALTITGQIRETEIAARLNALKDRQVTLIIDACHVGPGAPNAALVKPGRQVRCLGPALVGLKPPRLPAAPPTSFAFGGELATVWSAVDAGQWAPVEETASGAGGVFTRLFIEGVEGGAGRSEGAPSSGVSNAGLLDFVRRKTAEYCALEAGECRFGLLPQFYAPDDALGRDVVSGEPANSPIAAVQNTLKSDNALGVSVDILPGAALKVGQKVAMRAATKKPGYLILIDVDASGKLTQLYPNRRSMGLKTTVKTADNRLDPARPVIVPDAANPYVGFEYQVEGPPGVGMVVAVLSEKPVEVFDLPDVPTPLVGQRAALNYVYDLARSLRIVDEEEGAAKGDWSFDAKFYRVQ